MAKFISSAALTAFLLATIGADNAAVAGADRSPGDNPNVTYPPAPSDAAHPPLLPDRIRVLVTVDDGVRLLSWVIHVCEKCDPWKLEQSDLVVAAMGSTRCPFDDVTFQAGTYNEFGAALLHATVSGRSLEGSFEACATSEKLVKDCHVYSTYETKFRGTISADRMSINGEYLADGWAYTEHLGGLWTDCHHDDDFEAWLPVKLTVTQEKVKVRWPCGPDVVPGLLFIWPRGEKGYIYQAPSTTSPVISSPPRGFRTIYTQVSTENGEVWYKISPPGMTPGWYRAADATCVRPLMNKYSFDSAPPFDSGDPFVTITGSETTSSRG
jgi:hypothetical protein